MPQAGEYIWVRAEEVGFSKENNYENGNRFAVVPKYPNIFVIYTHSDLKRDWLNYIGLVLGESEYNGGYVLVLEKLNRANEPDWYFNLSEITSYPSSLAYKIENYNDLVDDLEISDNFLSWKPNTKSVYPLYGWLIRNTQMKRLGQKGYLWMNMLYSFLEKYPRYVNGYNMFDLHLYNIMKGTDGYFITDPIEEG